MCVTVPARVIEVRGSEAVVDVSGTGRRVSVMLLALEGVALLPGDWILSNAGMAIRRIEEEEAREVLGLFDEGGAVT